MPVLAGPGGPGERVVQRRERGDVRGPREEDRLHADGARRAGGDVGPCVERSRASRVESERRFDRVLNQRTSRATATERTGELVPRRQSAGRAAEADRVADSAAGPSLGAMRGERAEGASASSTDEQALDAADEGPRAEPWPTTERMSHAEEATAEGTASPARADEAAGLADDAAGGPPGADHDARLDDAALTTALSDAGAAGVNVESPLGAVGVERWAERNGWGWSTLTDQSGRAVNGGAWTTATAGDAPGSAWGADQVAAGVAGGGVAGGGAAGGAAGAPWAGTSPEGMEHAPTDTVAVGMTTFGEGEAAAEQTGRVSGEASVLPRGVTAGAAGAGLGRPAGETPAGEAGAEGGGGGEQGAEPGGATAVFDPPTEGDGGDGSDKGEPVPAARSWAERLAALRAVEGGSGQAGASGGRGEAAPAVPLGSGPGVGNGAEGWSRVAASPGEPAGYTPEARFYATHASSIVQSVRTKLLPGGGTVTLRLDPPELGALQVSLVMKDNLATVTFRAESAEAARLLSQTLAQLRDTLAAAGVVVDRMSVQQGSRPEGGSPGSGQGGGSGGGTWGGAGPFDAQDEQARREQQRRDLLERLWLQASGADRSVLA
ncbi:MAG: flagellar hook-length control protein FliK [Tepidisphaerales bacterium]